MSDRKNIGLGLTGFGIFFSFLGVVFLFDKGLLAMGNILFLSGVMMTIGLKSTMQFFKKRQNYKGTISFGIGFFLVLIGWPFMGMILEAYGFIVLFQWLLAHTGCISAKDAYCWLDLPTALCDVGLFVCAVLG